MILVLSTSAFALSLEEAVDRAAEVNPDALIATLAWRQSKFDALASWSSLTLTPQLAVSHSWRPTTEVDSASFSVSTAALDPGAWFDAAQQGAQAQAAGYAAEGTTLDVQYAVATLYVSALAAEARVTAARAGETAAAATLEMVRARVSGGLDSDLVLRSAQTAALVAKAESVQAAAALEVARISLSRALEVDSLDALAPAPSLSIPDAVANSPWVAAREADLKAARWDHLQAIAGWLPSGSLRASTPLDPMGWTVTLGATWTFDGILGPYANERQSALGIKLAEIELERLEADLAANLAIAAAEARAAAAMTEAARAREALAGESLQVGQTRLSAGLSAAFEVLRLQDDYQEAQADRVSAELAEATAVLRARQAAGIRWD